MVEVIFSAIVGVVIGYVVGNQRARSVKNDLEQTYEGIVESYKEALVTAEGAHAQLLREVQELRAKLTRKRNKPAQ